MMAGPSVEVSTTQAGRVLSWWAPWLLVVLCAASFLPGIGARDLWNPDEPRYAQVASEMSKTGSWFIPRLNDRVYTHKPPLLFWAISTFGWLRGGVDEVAARLPTFFAVTVAGVVVLYLGSLWFGRFSGWVAAACFLGCNSVQWRGRVGQIDMILTALILLSVGCFVLGRMRANPRWYLGFYLLSGVAILAKGPVGLLPPLLSIVVFLLWQRDYDCLKAFLRPAGFACVVSVVALWLVPAVAIAGPGYLRALLVEQTVQRYFEAPGHIQPFAYLWVIAPTDLLPFSLFFPAAVAALWKAGLFSRTASDGRAEWTRFLGVWSFVTILFFSLSAGKRSVYIMVVMASLSLLTAAGLGQLESWQERAGAGKGKARWPYLERLGIAAAWSICGMFVLVASLLPFLVAREPEYRSLGSGPLRTVLALLCMLVVVAFGAAVLCHRRKFRQSILVLGAAFGVFGGAASAFVLPAVDTLKSARALAEVVKDQVPMESRICIYPNPDAGFLFYGERLLEPTSSQEQLNECLDGESQTWLLIERDDLQVLSLGREMVEIARDSDWKQGHVLLRSRETPQLSDPQPGDLASVEVD